MLENDLNCFWVIPFYFLCLTFLLWGYTTYCGLVFFTEPLYLPREKLPPKENKIDNIRVLFFALISLLTFPQRGGIPYIVVYPVFDFFK